ncbi:BTAD domain-containing putative transcriptional regulator, partial [Mycobacterium sp. SP-6446]|uniref:BTAD domain-containing putative transcriptional regulator n=1 Tax=Mycobacterium sp. SP-6446 TaxID=1834162 RepID=UPI0020C9F6AB
MLGLHSASVVSADTLVELLWGEDPPRTAAKALQTHISSLRRTLGDGFILTQGAGWALSDSEVDVARYKAAARLGRDAAAAGDISQAVARFEEALALWRGIPELPDGRRGTSEKTRWIEGHAALVEDRADALLATGRAAEIVGELEAAVADAPLRERRWGQLMLALYRAGRQGEALGAYQRARALLADELGVDPGPDLRRLEAAIVAQDTSLEIPAAQQPSVMMRAVTFLLTDIEGSTAAWEAEADAMAVALARHDELVEQVVTSRGGRLIKTRGEGDATFSVFERPSAAASAAIELQEAIVQEPWALREPMRIRVALHTGEAELRDGDYFGRAVNRAARLRSLAVGGQILCSGATAELVIDSLADDVVLADLGMRELRNLARPEHVFELRLEIAETQHPPVPTDVPVKRPSLPAVLAGPGPFVGRGRELERLFTAWQAALAGGTNAVLIAGEPGVGKTRLAGEWSRQAYDQGALVIYGRCDEDLGAPYQPFAEALRSLVPCLGTGGLQGLRGVEALLALVPGLSDVLPDLATPTRADPDTERYALFDAVVALLGIASAGAPIILILDDLHWAAKPTLLLLRHLLRFGEHARVQIVATYRSTDLDRSHPLAAMLADLHRDGTANRLQLGGLDEDDVSAYVAEAGYDDEELARALASVTGGNPFFLIEALRHVDESGGRWDQSTLPQGVREAVSRRLSRLAPETNKALAAAAVVGSRFALDLVESVVGEDLVDALDEACKAGIVIEEPGGRYRFNHAIVRQSLLAELPSVRRMRLHQRIATTLESEPGADDELLAELAHHYFECAWAGNAAKAVEYCRRAADQAMTRLAYEGAADLYDRALHALEEIDDELPDRDDQTAELLIARCEALLAAGDVASAAGAVSQLQGATVDSARLAAWATCFDGQLSMLTHPERLEEVEAAVSAAADKLAELDDAAGEASAHTVRAGCLARLGRIGDAEIALDDALTAARRASEHRRVNAVLANAPLAALWGPNPVPRAGGRCLDVVRLLRITTDSPAVEATSTRCQAVLEAFRGRAAAARRMIDSARRTVSELGLRHALLEVEQFAGIVELVVDDPVAAEPHLRKAYNGFRRMGIDVCTAETAALLGRACLVLDRDAEADELCTESERLAGSALKASIAWRTLRAHLLARRGKHDEARRAAEAAVSLAERTDALVDHGDACLTLATVLGAAGDAAGARAAAERAADLYERKGAAALAERARRVLGEQAVPSIPTPPAPPTVEPANDCVRVLGQIEAAFYAQAWDAYEALYAPDVFVESRRKIVRFTQSDLPSGDWPREARRLTEMSGGVRQVVIAVRGERLALSRLEVGTEDLSPGAAQDEFLQLYGIDTEGRIALQVFFDIEDVDAAMAELDAAHARFEEEHPRAPLENAASRADYRFNMLFAERRWDDVGALLADDIRVEDRRRGLRREGNNRATELAELRAIADVGIKNMTSDVLAIRGERLALLRTLYTGRDQRPEAFHTELIRIAEVGADRRIAAYIAFDPNDFDAAIAELDARYLAGEASAHVRTWSVITGAYAALNRRELPPTTPSWVNIYHRRGTSFASGEMPALLDAVWKLTTDIRHSIEAVHRLNDVGAVITNASHETSQEGVDAEWRVITVVTVEGEMLSRCEVFDEDDLDAAIARFEELDRPASKLENTASRVFERLYSYVAVDDWHAVAQITAENVSVDDRRRVVNAGILHGRDANIRDAQATADVGFTMAMVGVLATRGGLLALTRVRVSGRDPEAIENDALSIIEVDAEERIAAVVVFDLDDFDDAIAELDARYLAGEGATHTRTWSIITDAYAALNRHEIAATTTDFASIDHRRGARFAPGDLIAYVRSGWELDQHISTYIERIHQLTDVGAVITHVVRGGPQEGLDAEWREAILITVDGDVINRSEMFDERDVDAALARFEELNRPVPRRLENAASRMYERFKVCFAARDWPGVKELYADNILSEDRRHPINSGVRQGPDALVAEMSAIAEVGIDITTSAVATRGEHLVLSRIDGLGRDEGADGFQVVALDVLELDADERFAARILFNLDDFDAAVAELDARYIAGEAAPYAQTWSVIAASYAAINRHEQPPTTPDWVNVDHRREVAMGPDDLVAYISAGLDSDQDITTYVETVHCLNRGGAVLTYAAQETSREGFNAEWRGVVVLLVSGDKVSRSELFDETDLDAAVVRFEQLSRTARRLENA